MKKKKDDQEIKSIPAAPAAIAATYRQGITPLKLDPVGYVHIWVGLRRLRAGPKRLQQAHVGDQERDNVEIGVLDEAQFVGVDA